MDLAKGGVAAGTCYPTLLPSTSGEETSLPGVSRVGCVASVVYREHQAEGMTACVLASPDRVSILGPDLEQRQLGRQKLLSRQLWRPCVIDSDPAVGDRSTSRPNGGGALPTSSRPERSAATIIALSAFLLFPLENECGTRARGTSDNNDDAVATVVAWVDTTARSHITVLTFSLRTALTASQPEASTLVSIVALDALLLPPTKSILRLFYHPAMTAETTGEIGGLTDSQPTISHVLTCAVYTTSPFSSTAEEAYSDITSAGAVEASTAAASNAAKKTSAATVTPSISRYSGVQSSVEHASREVRRVVQRRGELQYITVRVKMTSDGFAASWKASAGPATEAEVAPWLLPLNINRIVCAMVVQSSSTAVIAAVGTTDGRVFTVGSNSQRLVRRVKGPVADLIFARTTPIKAESNLRASVVDEFVVEAEAIQMKNGSFAGQYATEMQRRCDDDFSALVVLDSAGQLLILRAINSGAPITQSVLDVPQVITLQNREKQTLIFVDNQHRSTEEAPVSSRNFLDLNSLRHFFQRRRANTRRRAPHRSDTPPMQHYPASSSSLSPTPVNDSLIGNSSDEGILSGHILSRGLLCVTSTIGESGIAELVVSTMGQVVVSVPFDPNEGCFRIAGFTVTPAPMYYVGFVDFFGNGSPALVCASLQSVLVASSTQSVIKDRADLLLKLLRKKQSEAALGESGDPLDA